VHIIELVPTYQLKLLIRLLVGKECLYNKCNIYVIEFVLLKNAQIYSMFSIGTYVLKSIK